jgi:hypothetical protein
MLRRIVTFVALLLTAGAIGAAPTLAQAPGGPELEAALDALDEIDDDDWPHLDELDDELAKLDERLKPDERAGPQAPPVANEPEPSEPDQPAPAEPEPATAAPDASAPRIPANSRAAPRRAGHKGRKAHPRSDVRPVRPPGPRHEAEPYVDQLKSPAPKRRRNRKETIDRETFERSATEVAILAASSRPRAAVVKSRGDARSTPADVAPQIALAGAALPPVLFLEPPADENGLFLEPPADDKGELLLLGFLLGSAYTVGLWLLVRRELSGRRPLATKPAARRGGRRRTKRPTR